jgi:hypothetical protein
VSGVPALADHSLESDKADTHFMEMACTAW